MFNRVSNRVFNSVRARTARTQTADRIQKTTLPFLLDKPLQVLYIIYMDSEEIAALRKQLGWTMRQLGEYVGVSTQAVDHWLKGRCLPSKSATKLLKQLANSKTTMRIDLPNLSHFALGTTDQLSCSCCDRIPINDRFLRHMLMLDRMRSAWGTALWVTSGYRCDAHNKAVGGASQSQHLNFATDIKPNRPADVPDLADFAQNLGFQGIGLYPTFLHLDLRERPAQWAKR